MNVDIKDYGGVQGVDYMDPGRTIGLWNDTIAVLTSLGYEIGTCVIFPPKTTILNLNHQTLTWKKAKISEPPRLIGEEVRLSTSNTISLA
mgnify:CR=1 FL=1